MVEPSDIDTTNNAGSSEDDIPSGYMIPTLQPKDLDKGKIPFNLSEFKEQQEPKESIREHTISELPEVLTQEQSQLSKLNEWGVKEEQRITFDKERHIYVFMETLRPVFQSNQDQICHLPSLTYYAVSTPRYIYYEVESAQERPGWNMLYNIDTVIEHPIVSMTRIKELYGESLDQFPYITPSRGPAVSEPASPYWVESKEQIADEYLVTLGKHQHQFLGNLNPQREKVPKNQGSKDLGQDDREELIQSLIRSNGHLVADVAFLKRSVEDIANKYQEAYLRGQEKRENSGETSVEWLKRLKDQKQVQELRFDDKEKEKNDNQYDRDRQAQLAIYLKEGEKQLGELKERSRQELLEQQKQRDEFQQEQVDLEKAMQASLESEKRKLERIRKENLAELGQQDLLKELKEKQQQEIDLQVAKQLQLNENARAMKQNQAAEIGRLVQVIDERNGDLGKQVRLRKEAEGQDSGRLHKVDKEVHSGSKTLGDIERPWLTPPSPSPSPLPSPPQPPSPSDPGENPEDNPFRMNPRKYHFSGTVQDGDKGYFVGWYIDQKTVKDKWGKMKIINEEQAQPVPLKVTANETRKEDISARRPQDILDSYPQPLQMPYITNAMNPLPNQPTQSIQPPYYHSTPTTTS